VNAKSLHSIRGQLEKPVGKKSVNIAKSKQNQTEPNNLPILISGKLVQFYLKMTQG